MNSKDTPTGLEPQLNLINSLCDELDELASPTIEEEMVCPLVCCIGNGRYLRTLIDYAEEYEDMRFILDDEGLQLVRQLEKTFNAACFYDAKKGFSKTQRWLDFIIFVNKVNTFLKDAVKRDKAKIEKIR
jgi:hypothetical protein